MSGYANYNSNDYSGRRRYEFEQANTPKINIALWPDQMGSNESRWPMCPYDPHIKLQLIDNAMTWFCRECGNKTPIEEVKQDRKLVRKHGTRTSATLLTTIGTDKAKRKPKSSRELSDANGELSEEGKAELRAWGFNI